MIVLVAAASRAPFRPQDRRKAYYESIDQERLLAQLVEHIEDRRLLDLLVLARAIARRQEFAARFALGARPLRVARQLVTESALLAVAGGSLGLGLAWAGQPAFVAISPAMPRIVDAGIDIPALRFALIGVLFATCAAGLIPALQSSRRGVLDGLRRVGGAGRHRLRSRDPSRRSQRPRWRWC